MMGYAVCLANNREPGYFDSLSVWFDSCEQAERLPSTTTCAGSDQLVQWVVTVRWFLVRRLASQWLIAQWFIVRLLMAR